jgi:beta-RFAP synthase
VTSLDDDAVFVEAAARLHFGVLDLRGDLGRWFGGIGAAAEAPALLLSARPAEALEVDGEDVERAAGFARRFLEHHRIDRGAALHVHRALPPHAGLGSGTQLALAVGRALAEINGISTDAASTAAATGRGCRSAVGTWIFAAGGLVVEGGRRHERDGCGPLLARLSLPSTWRCVVAVPGAAPGLNGNDEAEAFAHLPLPPSREVQRIAHLVLMALLPAAAEGDLEAFGAALNQIQEVIGHWFAPVQGGIFATGPSAALARGMAERGALGVGQSSWGPAVYGIVEGEEAGQALADYARGEVGSSGAVYQGPFRSTGARIWRAPFRAAARR